MAAYFVPESILVGGCSTNYCPHFVCRRVTHRVCRSAGYSACRHYYRQPAGTVWRVHFFRFRAILTDPFLAYFIVVRFCLYAQAQSGIPQQTLPVSCRPRCGRRYAKLCGGYEAAGSHFWFSVLSHGIITCLHLGMPYACDLFAKPTR